MSNILIDKFESGALPHAVLLIGDESISTQLVTEFLESLRINVADYLVVPAGESIKVLDAKRIREFTQMSRFTSPIKLVFLADASALTPEAANALLKTLEEPPDGTHLVLATSKLDSLLPTIRSRCQVLYTEPGGDVVSNGEVPALIMNDLPAAFALSKELAASEVGLPEIFSAWIPQLSSDPRRLSVLLDYLGPAQTSVNRRLLLDNFCLEIYNSD